MIQIFKTADNETVEIHSIEHNCWINLKNPTETEIELVSQRTGLYTEFLRAALDEEETSRVEVDEDQICVILDIPVMDVQNKTVQYYTIPLGLVLNDSVIVTVCLQDNKVINDFMQKKVKSFYAFKKSRFILQILHKIATYYLSYLRQIDKTSNVIEARLHKSLRNKELIQLLSLEKSLVYFSTSLKSNEITLEKMLKLELMQKYSEDQDVLEDVIIENKQAIEMANIYSNILSGTMDAFASIISNNLNIVMKFLASITIVMSIPTMIASFLGMNVPIPFGLGSNPYGFPIIIGVTLFTAGIVTYALARKDMF
jgi:magnesium transporter